jgi:hypothetical protein
MVILENEINILHSCFDLPVTVVGIEHTICVAVFVIKIYFGKVAQPDERDNCKFEFQYARNPCGAHRMIPVEMEKSMRNTRCWTGQAGTTLHLLLYVDVSDEINDTNYEVLYIEIQRSIFSIISLGIKDSKSISDELIKSQRSHFVVYQ